MDERLQLQVRQSPRDLLARPREYERPPTAGNGRRGVEAWQDEHGELFFKDASVASRVFVPTPYGLAPRDYHRTSRVDALKRVLVKFLWDLMEYEDWGIRELFQQIRATPSCPEADAGSIGITFDSFAEFIDRYGFHSNRERASRQEWFAVLRSMQELSIDSAGGITFSALRTAVLDPFHMSFWDHYTRCLLQTGRSVDSTLDILRQIVSPRLPSRGVAAESAPWFEFLDSLTTFHAAIGLPEPTPSECCRLFYRFDSSGTGEIDVVRFVELMRIKLIELQNSNETPRRRLLPLRHDDDQATAVLNSRWRPNVEFFTTAKAVRNLFAARARAATYELDRASSGLTYSSSSSSLQISQLHCDQGVRGRINKEQIADFTVEMALLEEGNSRLARITSLPVTRLLREGTYFRGHRRGGKPNNTRANETLDGN